MNEDANEEAASWADRLSKTQVQLQALLLALLITRIVIGSFFGVVLCSGDSKKKKKKNKKKLRHEDKSVAELVEEGYKMESYKPEESAYFRKAYIRTPSKRQLIPEPTLAEDRLQRNNLASNEELSQDLFLQLVFGQKERELNKHGKKQDKEEEEAQEFTSVMGDVRQLLANMVSIYHS